MINSFLARLTADEHDTHWTTALVHGGTEEFGWRPFSCRPSSTFTEMRSYWMKGILSLFSLSPSWSSSSSPASLVSVLSLAICNSTEVVMEVMYLLPRHPWASDRALWDGPLSQCSFRQGKVPLRNPSISFTNTHQGPAASVKVTCKPLRRSHWIHPESHNALDSVWLHAVFFHLEGLWHLPYHQCSKYSFSTVSLSLWVSGKNISRKQAQQFNRGRPELMAWMGTLSGLW